MTNEFQNWRGAILTNQLIEKEMKEQNEQQSKRLEKIKERTAAIRKAHEEQYSEAGVFVPETYSQGELALVSSNIHC